jgi:hypothetical protein
MIITTIHGTKFEINTVNKTWARIDKTGDSGHLRDESGVFNEMRGPVIGESLYLFCPPRVAGAIGRAIITSPIKEIF